MKFGERVHCIYMLILTLAFIFSKFFSFIFFFLQIWSQNVKFFKFTEIWYIDYYMFISILLFIFSNFLSFIFLWANLVPKPELLQIDWNVVFWCLFFQNFNHSYFWANLIPQTEVLHIDWNLVQRCTTVCLIWFYCWF